MKNFFLGLATFVAILFFIASFWAFNLASRTVSPGKILHGYEWFYSVNAQYNSRVSQIRDVETQSSVDNNDKMKLRTELQAMRQSCRELANNYNAASEKITTSYFRGWPLPEKLAVDKCEVTKQ